MTLVNVDAGEWPWHGAAPDHVMTHCPRRRMRENIDVFALALTDQDMTPDRRNGHLRLLFLSTAPPPQSADPATSASTDRP